MGTLPTRPIIHETDGHNAGEGCGACFPFFSDTGMPRRAESWNTGSAGNDSKTNKARSDGTDVVIGQERAPSVVCFIFISKTTPWYGDLVISSPTRLGTRRTGSAGTDFKTRTILNGGIYIAVAAAGALGRVHHPNLLFVARRTNPTCPVL